MKDLVHFENTSMKKFWGLKSQLLGFWLEVGVVEYKSGVQLHMQCTSQGHGGQKNARRMASWWTKVAL